MARFDPTRSITLRRRFSQDASRRYLNVRYDITEILEDLATQPGGITVYDDAQVGNSFEGILRQRLQSEFSDKFYVDYMTRGYLKGVRRAYLEAAEADDIPVGPGSKNEFIRQLLSSEASTKNVDHLLQRARIDLDAINEEVIKQATNEVADGIARGESIQEISKRAKDRINKIGRTRSKAMAHTAVVRGHAEGQLDSFRNMGVRELGVEVEWMTARYPCPLCKAMQGVVLPIEQTRGMIPRHPNCVVGETQIVAANVSAAMKAEFSGTIFDLVAASGRRLSVTPNHILLTQRGWVFAKDLTNSDYLVDALRQGGTTIGPNNDSGHPAIGDVFRSLVKVGDKSAVVQALAMPEHLHGDGISVNEKIDIVNVDRILRNHSNAAFGTKVVEGVLQVGNVRSIQPFGLPEQSAFSARLSRLSRTSDGIVRSAGVSSILRARSLAYHQTVGTGLGSELNAFELQDPVNDITGDTVSLGEGIDTSSLFIQLSNLAMGQFVKLRSVECRHVQNLPVYDLTTQETSYIANGFVTSNCRCRWKILDSPTTRKRRRGYRRAVKRSLKAERKKSKRKSQWSGAAIAGQ